MSADGGYLGHRLFDAEGGQQGIELRLQGVDGQPQTRRGVGSGPVEAAVAALGLPLRIDSFEQKSLGHGAQAQSLAVIEAAWPGQPGTRFGAALHANTATAAVRAVLSAAARWGESGRKGN